MVDEAYESNPYTTDPKAMIQRMLCPERPITIGDITRELGHCWKLEDVETLCRQLINQGTARQMQPGEPGYDVRVLKLYPVSRPVLV